MATKSTTTSNEASSSITSAARFSSRLLPFISISCLGHESRKRQNSEKSSHSHADGIISPSTSEYELCCAIGGTKIPASSMYTRMEKGMEPPTGYPIVWY